MDIILHRIQAYRHLLFNRASQGLLQTGPADPLLLLPALCLFHAAVLFMGCLLFCTARDSATKTLNMLLRLALAYVLLDSVVATVLPQHLCPLMPS